MNKKEDVIDEKTINDINYKLLKKQFPHAVSIDKDGKYIIDPQKLQMSLDPSKAKIKEDGYGLNWVGKKEAYHTAFSKNYKVLKPLNDDNSKNWESTDNILIKGDNLDALKILRQNYFEAIKMIYIDPPYNTKNDGFVYNDNFTSSTTQTLEELGYDEENIEYIENIQGAKTHSGWLSFMYPRLLLAKDLLKDDGVIFISIDDNEVAQLRLLCDEVFGEDNFFALLTRRAMHTVRNSSKDFNFNADYILVYAKNKQWFSSKKENFIRIIKDKVNNYKLDDNDGKGRYKLDPLNARNYAKPYKFTFSNGEIWEAKNGTYPRYSIETLKQKDLDGEIVFGGKEPKVKRYLSKVQEGQPPNVILDSSDVGFNSEGTVELRELLEEGNLFSQPKNTKFIKFLCLLLRDKNTLILDFFAGSGTTAHAVMDLNAEDGGKRKFICVQIAEKTPEKSEAKKAGYETIFDITSERIKRAGDKIVKGDLTQQDLDIGFRTFEIIEDTKQKIYQKPLEEMRQDDLLTFTQNCVESSEDILYNLLVAESLPLSTKIEELIVDRLYIASNVAFVLGNVTIDELITKLKSKKELEYITIYSPNISNDKFTLELESAVASIGIKSDKIKFRG